MEDQKGLIQRLKETFGEQYSEEELIEQVKEWQKRANVSQKMMSELYEGIDKREFERHHAQFIDEMRQRYAGVKRKTGGGVLDLYEFIEAMGEVGDLMLRLAPGIAPHEAFAEYRFWIMGEKIYSIHQNLCERFLATHIKSIPIDLLRLPFPAFRIAVPDKLLPYRTYEGRIVYMRELTVVDYFEKMTGVRKVMILYRAYDDIGYFSIPIIEDEVHKCCETACRRWFELEDAISQYYEVCHKMTEERKTQMMDMFEFVMKCILYITGANADVKWVDERPHIESQLRRAKSTGKMKKLQRRLENAKRMYLVGHQIILSREEKMMYENIKQGLWNVSYRFIVQGHWRNQACGPNRSERRHIFIEPYWKGPEYSMVVNNPHLVK